MDAQRAFFFANTEAQRSCMPLHFSAIHGSEKEGIAAISRAEIGRAALGGCRQQRGKNKAGAWQLAAVWSRCGRVTHVDTGCCVIVVDA